MEEKTVTRNRKKIEKTVEPGRALSAMPLILFKLSDT
jgi:hypothetical protein